MTRTAVADRGTVRISLLPHQRAFFYAPDQIVLLDGGFGAGKTDPLVEWAWDECARYPHNLVLLGRHEYTDLADSTIRSFFDFLERIHYPRTFNESSKVYTHPNGSQILFRHLDDEAGLKNLNLGAVGIDQAEEIEPSRFDLLLGRLRRPGSSRKVRLTANPNGHDWLWQLFYGPGSVLWYSPHITERVPDSECYREGYKVIRCTSHDNPFLPPGYIERMLKDYPPEFVAQYVNGSREVTLDYRFFDQGALARQPIMEPISTGYFVDGLPKPEWRETAGGPVRLYERWDERDLFVVALDVATGEGSSWSAGVMRNTRFNRVAAVIDADLRPDELAVQGWFLSRAYGNALIAPERNGIGFSVVSTLQTLTARLFTGQRSLLGQSGAVNDVGWLTDARSRAELFALLQREIAHRSIELKDRELLEQCKAITMTKGKPKASKGFRDDLVLACGISGMVRKLQPSLATARHESSPIPELKPELARAYGYGRRKDVVMAGR